MQNIKRKKDNSKDKKADCRQRAEAIACPFNADKQARIKRIILTLHFFRHGSGNKPQ